MSGHYPIRAVAQLTGLSIDTLRQWERRYSAVVPVRTTRGRQYSGEQIERLISIRQLIQRGHSIGQIADLPDAALQDLLIGVTAPSRNAPGAPPAPASPTLSALIDAFASFQVQRANDELGRLAALLAPRDLIFDVVLPLMREVGERWHRGQMGIAQEHLISSALRNLLGSLVRLYPPRPGSPEIVIATLSGELHEFGILAAAMIAATSGMNPILLGPNLPAPALAEAVAQLSARIVLVACSSASPDAEQQLSSLAQSLPPATELWVGGQESANLHQSEFGSRFVSIPDMETFEKLCQRRSMVAPALSPVTT